MNDDSTPPSRPPEDGSGDDKPNALVRLIDQLIEIDPKVVAQYVDKLRSQNPVLTNDELARKIVSRKSHKNGLVGAATGIPGLLALPLTIPADVYASWKIQIYMALCIAYAYGHTAQTTDLRSDIYLILAGDAAKEALKRAGIAVGKELTKRAVSKYVTREVMKKIGVVLSRKIITKAGEKSLTSFMKLVPLVGAPVGYAFDWGSAQIVGRNAIKYYSGRG